MVDINEDGVIDILPQNLSFILNYGSDFSQIIQASSISVAPGWTGFLNPTVNDDMAIITLSTPLPASVPTYLTSTSPWASDVRLTQVGYGISGDGINGFTVGASFTTKRVGQNMADGISEGWYDLDDEGSGKKEVFYTDFDGPTGTGLFGGSTLGNNIETTTAPGDSGGPSFLSDTSGNPIYQDGKLVIFGVNTFGFTMYDTQVQGTFGTGAGGIVVSAYDSWIRSTVPDTTSTWLPMAMSLASLFGIRSLRRSTKA